jgi:hypothetical protein
VIAVAGGRAQGSPERRAAPRGLVLPQALDHERLQAHLRAQTEIRTALDRVRTIAHGLYPAALGDAGLAAALDVLAEWRPHLELGDPPSRRFDPVVEAGRLLRRRRADRVIRSRRGQRPSRALRGFPLVAGFRRPRLNRELAG